MKYGLLLVIGLAACSSSITPGDSGQPRDSATDMNRPDGIIADSNVPDSPIFDSSPTDTGERIPMRHRAEHEICDNVRPRPPIPSDMGCMSHEDCVDGDNGRCTAFGRGLTDCTYDGCFSDDDCSNTACICEGSSRSDANVCLGGDCQVDADCGVGGFCSPSFGDCGAFAGVVTYFCHTPADECVDDEDCDTDCRYSEEVSHWVCGGGECVG